MANHWVKQRKVRQKKEVERIAKEIMSFFKGRSFHSQKLLMDHFHFERKAAESDMASKLGIVKINWSVNIRIENVIDHSGMSETFWVESIGFKLKE